MYLDSLKHSSVNEMFKFSIPSTTIYYVSGTSSGGSSGGLIGADPGLLASSGLASTVSTLQWSMISVAAWGAVMTVAVAALAVVVYRRWKRAHYPMDNQSTAGSSGDLSDISSSLGSSIMGINESVEEGGGNEQFIVPINLIY